MSNNPPLRPPPRPRSPQRSQSSLSQASLQSSSSLSTDHSADLNPPPMRRSPFMQQQPLARPSTAGGLTPSQSSSTINTVPRHVTRGSVDGSGRIASPTPGQQVGHRARQHSQGFSQGFFEPSLPHATANNHGLTASQIAAQAAMHNVSPPPSLSERKKSFPGLNINTTGPASSRRPSHDQSPQNQLPPVPGLGYSNGNVGGSRLAATTAANVAFPNGRSPLPSPGMPPPPGSFSMGPPPDKEQKSKGLKSKMFNRPKNIILSKDKDARAPPTFPSPGKTPSTATFLRSGFANASTTSLVDPMSSASSLYSSANASTSTLVPTTSEKDKEKRHHFLSRQKNKLRDEPGQLPLSSAHSNSQATNPDKPQPLYSFTPDSPGPGTFAKSMSGFDLRHGGRALREKKKEEKAAAAAAKLDLTPIVSNTSATGTSDQFLGPSSYETNLTGPPTGSGSVFAFPSETALSVTAQAFSNIGAQMGLPGIGPDDAWPLLKARLLNLFSGESLRTPIEDFNALVSVHVRRCIQRRSPIVLVEDVRELLQTGFSSLAQTLRGVPDDRLVTNLVEMWIGVYGAILPFLQAVFLPLELEFKGRGSLMSAREAQEFWGAIPEALKSDERPASAGGTSRPPTLHEELEIRRITLITFRDEVILPRHEVLMTTFSRLSLDSINAGVPSDNLSKGREHARSDPVTGGAERPGTAGSLSPRLSSFNSQGSTLLDAASNSSGGAMSLASRSRATSNTSAGSFGTSMPHLISPSLSGPGSFNPTSQPAASPVVNADPAKVTETVARMLQCLYVLASCQTGDVAQGNVERLTGALKYNWLGRGRTGRDRRGWVGMKAGRGVGLVGA